MLTKKQEKLLGQVKELLIVVDLLRTEVIKSSKELKLPSILATSSEENLGIFLDEHLEWISQELVATAELEDDNEAIQIELDDYKNKYVRGKGVVDADKVS